MYWFDLKMKLLSFHKIFWNLCLECTSSAERVVRERDVWAYFLAGYFEISFS